MTKEEKSVRNKAYYKTHKQELSAYAKAWYKVNKEKKLAQSKAYYKTHKEEISVQSKAHYQANKEEIKARCKAYYKTHKEEISVKTKAYRETHKEEISVRGNAHYKDNKEKIRAQQKVNYETRKEEYTARSLKRRALKTQSILPTTDNELIKNLYKLRKFMTEEHGEQYHVDHIIPLSIGGAHHQDNMRVITAKENLGKKDKYIPELGGVWADNDLAREYKKKHNIE